MMLHTLQTRERRLAVATTVVVSLCVIYRFLVLPQLSNMWALDERASTVSLDLLQMEKAVALTDRIENQYKAYESVISQKGSDLEEMVSFLRRVSDLTAANEMKLVGLEQTPVEVNSYYKLYSVRLGVETRPVWLARFLASIQKSNDLIRVADITITALDDAENLSINMKLTKVVAARGTPK